MLQYLITASTAFFFKQVRDQILIDQKLQKTVDARAIYLEFGGCAAQVLLVNCVFQSDPLQNF